MRNQNDLYCVLRWRNVIDFAFYDVAKEIQTKTNCRMKLMNDYHNNFWKSYFGVDDEKRRSKNYNMWLDKINA